MEFKVQLTLAFLVWSFVTTAAKCPDDGEKWDSDFKEGERCILRCKDGLVPSDCHVIRPIEGGGFNKPIPKCETAPWVSGKIVASITVGVAAVAAAPFVLTAFGFTTAGVAGGSLAAGLQTPFTAAGGLFATGQSVGAAGLGMAAKTALGGSVSFITNYVMHTYTGCENE